MPQLRQAGYSVRYREFAGPHTVPLEVAREGLEWFTGTAQPGAAVDSQRR